jgi:hypothetical protein
MNRFDTEEMTGSKNIVAADNEQETENKNVSYNDVSYRSIYYKKSVPDSRLIVFLGGVCVGMIFFYALNGVHISKNLESLPNVEQLLELQLPDDIGQSGLFERVLRLRLKQIAFWGICSICSIGSLIAYSLLGWYGFELGILFFSWAYQCGIKGIFFSTVMLLPHGIFYIIIFLIIFNKYWKNDTKYYHKEAVKKNNVRYKIIYVIKKIIIIFSLLLIGIFCEIIINPAIIRKLALLFK